MQHIVVQCIFFLARAMVLCFKIAQAIFSFITAIYLLRDFFFIVYFFLPLIYERQDDMSNTFIPIAAIGNTILEML